MAYTKKTWVSGETPLSAENMNNIENGIANAHEDISKLNTKLGKGLYNATTSGITSYPMEVGTYRVTTDVAGLPNGSAMFGVLFIVDGGTYIMHLFIDARNAMYWCRTNGFGVPETWEKASSTSVTAIS